MSNPEANASELNPFSVVTFQTTQTKPSPVLHDRVAILLTESNNTPTRVIVAGDVAALQAFKDAVDTANTFVDAGTPPNVKMINEHPAIIDSKKQDQLIGINPAIRQAALDGKAVIPNIDKTPAVAQKNYAFNRDGIPDSLIKSVRSKLGDKAQVTPPYLDGKYKGKVVFENKDYLVQGVYKKVPEGYAIHNAVAHRKAELELLTENHKWRSENNRFGGQEIRIYYDADKGKVYPYSLEKELQERAAKSAGVDVSNLNPKARGEALESKGVSIPQVPASKQKAQQPSMDR